MKKLLLRLCSLCVFSVVPAIAAVQTNVITNAPYYHSTLDIGISYPVFDETYLINISSGGFDVTVELEQGSTFYWVYDNSSTTGHYVHVYADHDVAYITITGIDGGLYTITGSYWGSSSTSMDSHINAIAY